MGYLNSDALITELTNLQTAHDRFCTVVELPHTSHLGKTIKAILLTDLLAPTPSNPIPVLIIGGVHAREWAPPDALVEFAARLLDARENNTAYTDDEFTVGGVQYTAYSVGAEDVADIFSKLLIVMLPLVNPDGRDVSLLGTNFETAMWRKNRHDVRTAAETQTLTAPGCIGVDINRNFPIAWDFETYYSPAAAKFANASKSKCHFQRYRGPEPAAGAPQVPENETRNVMHLADEYNVRAFLDVHMTGRNVTYPWGIEGTTTDVAKQGQSFTSPQWDRKRDGLPRTGDVYQEFMPAALLTRLKDTAAIIAGEIERSAGASPVARGRSRYALSSTADSSTSDGFTPRQTFIGCSDDYVFSRQFANDGAPECLAFTLEAGLEENQRKSNPHEHDGGFFPLYLDQFLKVRREIHAGIFGLLKALR